MDEFYKPKQPAVMRSLYKVAQLAQRHERVVVAYSGGKDSSTLLDIVYRTFRNPQRIVACHEELVPGLRITEKVLELPKRLGIPYCLYRSGLYFAAKKIGLYCHPIPTLVDFNTLDVFLAWLVEHNATLVVAGHRNQDGLFRRGLMKTLRKSLSIRGFECAFPLNDWTREDVLAYVNVRQLPIIEQSKLTDSDGVRMTVKSILYLHDNVPEDYEKIKRHFPFIDAIVARREYYGVDGTVQRIDPTLPYDVKVNEVKEHERRQREEARKERRRQRRRKRINSEQNASTGEVHNTACPPLPVDQCAVQPTSHLGAG